MASKKVVFNQASAYTHFVSLPLAIHPRLVQKLVSFQNEILAKDLTDQIDRRIDKSLFIKPTTFHLTVLMLKLQNKDQITAASQVLQNVSLRLMEVLQGRSVSIKLNGMALMKGSLSEARVVYAPIEEAGGEGRLLRACGTIIDAFVGAGLVLRKDVGQKLNLHATLMNVSHRRNIRKTMVDSFDARAIFDKYGSEEWGEYDVCEAHLSQRFVYDDNGYFHCCSSIPFPARSRL